MLLLSPAGLHLLFKCCLEGWEAPNQCWHPMQRRLCLNVLLMLVQTQLVSWGSPCCCSFPNEKRSVKAGALVRPVLETTSKNRPCQQNIKPDVDYLWNHMQGLMWRWICQMWMAKWLVWPCFLLSPAPGRCSAMKQSIHPQQRWPGDGAASGSAVQMLALLPGSPVPRLLPRRTVGTAWAVQVLKRWAGKCSQAFHLLSPAQGTLLACKVGSGQECSQRGVPRGLQRGRNCQMVNGTSSLGTLASRWAAQRMFLSEPSYSRTWEGRSCTGARGMEAEAVGRRECFSISSFTLVWRRGADGGKVRLKRVLDLMWLLVLSTITARPPLLGWGIVCWLPGIALGDCQGFVCERLLLHTTGMPGEFLP